MAGGGQRLRVFTRDHLERIPQLEGLGAEERLVMRAVSAVLPFRVNEYVCEELIDWSRVPDDPIFQLAFPQPGMLPSRDLRTMLDALRDDDAGAIRRCARTIQLRLNPHPAGQRALNIPTLDGSPLLGMQHKYRETVLFFPLPAQSCHTYCSYCFRWPQFAKLDDTRFANPDPGALPRYLERHPEVTSVLFTGGDPMVMSARVLARFVEPVLTIDSVRSVRIGTKSLAWWPHRFVSDADADDVLRLFERVIASGKHLALMAHASHPRELAPVIARTAIERIRSTGAVIRSQTPVARRVNDDANTWAELWQTQVQLGIVPYYMFVGRDTGAQHYFEVTLARALEIYQRAVARVSGLARTARGPVMSATPGKVLVDGATEIAGQPVFVLKFLQAREPAWNGRVFLAGHDPNATWLDDLRPAFDDEFFFRRRGTDTLLPANRSVQPIEEKRDRYVTAPEPSVSADSREEGQVRY